jgi:hypothetical protein
MMWRKLLSLFLILFKLLIRYLGKGIIEPEQTDLTLKFIKLTDMVPFTEGQKYDGT